MEVYIVARTGRPKSDNPTKTLIGLKLTEEEAARPVSYTHLSQRYWLLKLHNRRLALSLSIRWLLRMHPVPWQLNIFCIQDVRTVSYTHLLKRAQARRAQAQENFLQSQLESRQRLQSFFMEKMQNEQGTVNKMCIRDRIADDIRTGNVKPLSIFLQASIDEGIDEDSESCLLYTSRCV